MDQVIRLLVFCPDNLDSAASTESSLVDETFHQMRRSRWSPKSEFGEFVYMWRSVAFWIKNSSYQGNISRRSGEEKALMMLRSEPGAWVSGKPTFHQMNWINVGLFSFLGNYRLRSKTCQFESAHHETRVLTTDQFGSLSSPWYKSPHWQLKVR